MDVIYGLIPGMLFLGLAAVAVLFWATRTGQYDDLDGDGRRILMDEDAEDVDPRRAPPMDAEPDLMNPVACDLQSDTRHHPHTDQRPR